MSEHEAPQLGGGLRLGNPFVARLGGAAGFWVAWEPRAWPAPAVPYSGLATGQVLLGTGRPVALRADVPAAVADTVWLPPIASAHGAGLDALSTALAARGAPVLRQLLAAEVPEPVSLAAAADPAPLAPAAPAAHAAAATAVPSLVIWDPLPLLLAGDRDRLLAAAAAAPAGAAAVWPLLGSLAGATELALVAPALQRAGVVALQPLRLELSAPARRWCAAELTEAQWERAFHPSPEVSRELLRTICAAGLAPIVPRPAPAGPLALRASNRPLATELFVAAELAARLGRSPGRVAELAGVARRLELLAHDVRILWRDGNLGVLEFLGHEDEREVAAWCATGVLPLRRQLEQELGAPLTAAEATAADAVDSAMAAPCGDSRTNELPSGAGRREANNDEELE